MDINFECAKCSQHMVIDEVAAGTSIDCPNCSNPVYVPSLLGTASKPIPTRVPVGSARPLATLPDIQSLPISNTRPNAMDDRHEVHPAITGSLHCLLILVGLGILGLIVIRQNMLLAPAFIYMATPFMIAQVLCATYGICKGHVKHGLLVLSGFAIVIGLAYWISVVAVINAFTTNNSDFQRQIQKSLQPFSR